MGDEFTVKLSVIVVCDKLKKPIYLDHEMVNGVPFFKACRKDTGLAKLCNQFVGRQYFPDVNVFEYMQDRRNSEVTRLIQQAMQQDDLFADTDVAVVPVGNERAELFHKHKIPDIITLDMPAFTAKGKEVAVKTIKVLATPKLAASISMEANGANLSWFKDACSASWIDKERKKRKLADVINVDGYSDRIKFVENSDKKISMYCNYKRHDGTWNKFYQSVTKAKFDSDEQVEEAVARCVARMEAFLQEHHHVDHVDTGDNQDMEPSEQS